MSKRLQLDTIIDPSGREVFDWYLVMISDLHAFSEAFRAERFCQLMRGFFSKYIVVAGDGYAGQENERNEKFHAGPFHPQALAHIWRKAGWGAIVKWLWGNHETGIEDRDYTTVRYDPEYGDTLIKPEASVHIELALKAVERGIITPQQFEEYRAIIDMRLEPPVFETSHTDIEVSKYYTDILQEYFSDWVRATFEYPEDEMELIEALRPHSYHKPHRRFIDVSIGDVEFTDAVEIADPDGIITEYSHGHKPDHALFGAKTAIALHSIGNYFKHLGDNHDKRMREKTGNEDYCLTADIKTLFKSFIHEKLGVRKIIAQNTNKNPRIEASAHGHDHMGGFEFTETWNQEFIDTVDRIIGQEDSSHSRKENLPHWIIDLYYKELDKGKGGKVVKDSGSCTEHVNAQVIDRAGTEAFITWHKYHMDVELKDGTTYKVIWKRKQIWNQDLIDAVETAIEQGDEIPFWIMDVYNNEVDKTLDDPNNVYLEGMEHLADVALPQNAPNYQEDKYDIIVRRLMRIAERQWQSLERQRMNVEMESKREFVAHIESKLKQSIEVPYTQMNQYFNVLAQIHRHYALSTPREDIPGVAYQRKRGRNFGTIGEPIWEDENGRPVWESKENSPPKANDSIDLPEPAYAA